MRRWAEALAVEYPANAVNFDSILPGEAAALKDTPITVALPCYAKPLSLPKPVCSMLSHSGRAFWVWRRLCEHHVFADRVQTRRPDLAFGGPVDCLLTERGCCKKSESWLCISVSSGKAVDLQLWCHGFVLLLRLIAEKKISFGKKTILRRTAK